MNLPKPGEPCAHCDRVAGDWNAPCVGSPDGLHWTVTGRREWAEEKLAHTARSLSRACYELEQLAEALDQLPERLRGKLRRSVAPSAARLSPDLIRNEAERGRDTLHVYGLLDL